MISVRCLLSTPIEDIEELLTSLDGFLHMTTRFLWDGDGGWLLGAPDIKDPNFWSRECKQLSTMV